VGGLDPPAPLARVQQHQHFLAAGRAARARRVQLATGQPLAVSCKISSSLHRKGGHARRGKGGGGERERERERARGSQPVWRHAQESAQENHPPLQPEGRQAAGAQGAEGSEGYLGAYLRAPRLHAPQCALRRSRVPSPRRCKTPAAPAAAAAALLYP
jgi:hypothetical protein